MHLIQIVSLMLIALFYAAYFSKMLLQRRKGLRADQMGKGKKPGKLLVIEILLKIATYSVVLAQIVTILNDFRLLRPWITWLGVVLAGTGVLIFIIAMWIMRDSWRAGIPAQDTTELVTGGIYRFSRNPAFLGFDLMYLGLLIAFFNVVHLLFVIFAVVMLHLQILQEERYLEHTFGKRYQEYAKKTGRYFVYI